MPLLLALLLTIPPCASGAASSAQSASTPTHSVTVCTIPFIRVVTRGNNPQWVKVRGGAWVPTSVQLQTMRKAFKAYVAAQAHNAGISLSPWRQYTFQYQGQLSHGSPLLLVYAFCQIDADYPRQKLAEQFYFVNDGGACYFRARWSPKRHSFVDIAFNGK